MKTMFTEEKSKILPKDFNDCLKEDNVSSNLWLWGERLEKWGKILFVILIIVGVILSITTSIITIKGESSYNSKTTFSFENFVGVLLQYAIYAFIEYCAYHVLALLVCSLARIVQSSKITASLAIFNSKGYSYEEVSNNQTEDNKKDERKEEKNIGKCQMCNAENVEVKYVKLFDNMGTRYRNLCSDCLKKYDWINYK